MFIRNIKEFKKKTNKKKIICLDYGKKRVGVAISDEYHKITIPMKTLLNNKELNKEIKILIDDFDIGGVLVGLPIDENKKKNKMSQSIIDKIKNTIFFLKNNGIKLPFFFGMKVTQALKLKTLQIYFLRIKKNKKKILINLLLRSF